MNRVKDYLWQKVIDLNAWEVYHFLRKESFVDVEACFATELAYYEKHPEYLIDCTALDVTLAIFARAGLRALRKGNDDLAGKIINVVETHKPE